MLDEHTLSEQGPRVCCVDGCGSAGVLHQGKSVADTAVGHRCSDKSRWVHRIDECGWQTKVIVVGLHCGMNHGAKPPQLW